MSDNEKYGYFEIRLAEYLREHKISKNRLAAAADLQRTQLNQYCANRMQRIDLGVMSRICNALDCELSDIVCYVREEDSRTIKSEISHSST